MENLQYLVVAHGWAGLLVVSFLTATIIPLSSEAAVYAALRLGMPAWEVLLFASIGNCLGIMFNYGLGRWGSDPLQRRMERSRTGRRAMAWSTQYGKWVLLLSWLPFIGDPLTIVAGVTRISVPFFICVAGVLRVFRYAVVLAVIA